MNEPKSQFIGAPIIVEYDQPPLLPKKPSCPQRIIWEGERFSVLRIGAEWHDYQRRGRMGMNMRPSNLRKAMKRGSWGVGRYYFRVQLSDGFWYDIYYDRAPKGQQQRHGSWHLYRRV
jgi:hypothetical protein